MSACDEQLVTFLLALAFPGQIQLPRPPRKHVVAAAATDLGADRRESIAAAAAPAGSSEICGTVVSIRDQQTRENSLSCICSIVKVMQEYILVPELNQFLRCTE